MGLPQPKQYLKLAGKPLLFHALAALCKAPEIGAVYVVLAIDDAQWGRHDWSLLGPKLKPLFCGGPSRGDSVLNGLRAMSGEVGVDDWVLVHDAARPCLGGYHIEALMQQVSDDDVGAILAVPVADTLKRADAVSTSLQPWRATVYGRRRRRRCFAIRCCAGPWSARAT